jgi:hypothetical protein
MTPIISEFMPQPPVDFAGVVGTSQTNHRSTGTPADQPA